MTRTTWKIAFWSSLALSILSLLWNFQLTDQYSLQGALQPDAASGRVVAFSNHALTVYVTSSENLLAQGTMCGFFGFLFFAGWVSQKLGWRWPSANDGQLPNRQ